MVTPTGHELAAEVERDREKRLEERIMARRYKRFNWSAAEVKRDRMESRAAWLMARVYTRPITPTCLAMGETSISPLTPPSDRAVARRACGSAAQVRGPRRHDRRR